MKSNDLIIENYTSTSTSVNLDNYKIAVTEKQLMLEENILNRIDLQKKANILDIGCGWGGALKALQEKGFENLYGVDISIEQTKFATENLKLQNITCQDAVEYLKSVDQKFDAIFCFDVLEHLEINYAIVFLKALKDSLNPNGKIIITTPNGITPIQAYYYSDITHVKPYTTVSMKQITSLAGIEKINFYNFVLPSNNTKRKIANALFKYLFSPLTKIYVFALTQSTYEGVYSANLLSILE